MTRYWRGIIVSRFCHTCFSRATSACKFPCPSIRRDECILVRFKVMDTSVYFNEIYSVDTQADWFVCWKLRTILVPLCVLFSTYKGTVRSSVDRFVRSSIRQHLPGCLVSTTPVTVLYWSFWNFACVFFMVWGCANGLSIIVRTFFCHFFHVVNLVVFHPQYIDIGYCEGNSLYSFFTDCFETLHIFLHGMRIWYMEMHVVWI